MLCYICSSVICKLSPEIPLFCCTVSQSPSLWLIGYTVLGLLLNCYIYLMICDSYGNQYMEYAKLKSSEQVNDHKVMERLKVELKSNQ